MSMGPEYPYGHGYTLGPPGNEYYRPGGQMALKTCLAMFIATGASGLAEDACVNNFTFRHATETGALEADDFTEVRAAVSAFYEQSGAQGTQAAQAYPIGEYLSPWLARTAELRLYDASQGKPRTPIISSINLGTAGSIQGAPEEVAACLSFRTENPNTGRRRGRVYIGPLAWTPNGVVPSTVDGPARLGVALREDLLKAANRMSMMSASMRWVTMSGFDSDTTFHPVVHAWCDDALDTQRRRGPGAGSRNTLDLQPPV